MLFLKMPEVKRGGYQRTDASFQIMGNVGKKDF
jgi:hypothetical protein